MNTQHHDTRPSGLDGAADRILRLDSVVYGDERERRITLEGTAFAWPLTLYAAQILGVGAMATGAAGASVAFLLLATCSGMSAAWYAKRRQVDFTRLAANDMRLLRRVQAWSTGLILLWCGALAFYGYTGHPLIQLPDWTRVDGPSDTLFGAGVGGAVGALVGAVAQMLLARRRRSRVEEAIEPDDEF